MKSIKNWNWSGFLFILILCELGALSNKSIKNTNEALLFGLIVGIIVGIPIAIISKEN